jgi:hypothetical protein
VMFLVLPPKDKIAFDNTTTVASYTKIEANSKLLLQESCIRVLNDKIELVKSTQFFKSCFGYDLDHKTIRYNEF